MPYVGRDLNVGDRIKRDRDWEECPLGFVTKF